MVVENQTITPAVQLITDNSLNIWVVVTFIFILGVIILAAWVLKSGKGESP